MRLALFIAIFELFLMATLQEQTFNTYFPKVFLFGDSLTQKGFHDGGWGAKLVENFERKCDFLNRGFSGYTSRMAKAILPSLMENDARPKDSLFAATVLLGSNDAVLDDKDDRHVPIDEFKENLMYIISTLEKNGIQTENIILISPPPIDIDAWTANCKLRGRLPVSYSEEQLVLYVNASVSFANELNLRCIDLWNGMLEHKNWREFFYDGLHFSKEGHEFLYERIKEHLDVILAPLNKVFPDWKDLDHINPGKYFKSN